MEVSLWSVEVTICIIYNQCHITFAALFLHSATYLLGIMEFRNGNTFATTAFTSYGIFWWTLCFLWSFPKMYFQTADGEFVPLAAKPPVDFVAWYLFIWGLFTLFMFFGTLKKDYTIRFVFGALATLFFLLAIRDWLEAGEFHGASNVVGKIAGWEGIVTGISAMYYAMAQVINAEHGRVIMPIGAVTPVVKKDEGKVEAGIEEEREKLTA